MGDGKEPGTFEINTHSFHTVVKIDDEKQLEDWKTAIAQEIEKRKASRATKRELGARGNKELISKKGSINSFIAGRLGELKDGEEGRDSRGMSRTLTRRVTRNPSRASETASSETPSEAPAPPEVEIAEHDGKDDSDDDNDAGLLG